MFILLFCDLHCPCNVFPWLFLKFFLISLVVLEVGLAAVNLKAEFLSLLPCLAALNLYAIKAYVAVNWQGRIH